MENILSKFEKRHEDFLIGINHYDHSTKRHYVLRTTLTTEMRRFVNEGILEEFTIPLFGLPVYITTEKGEELRNLIVSLRKL